MSQRTEDALTDAQKQTDLTNAFLSIAYQDQVSRRTALKGLLGLAGAAVLFGLPRAAGAAEATQETLDALAEAQAEYDAVQAQLNEIASQFQALTVQQGQTLDKIEDVQLQIDDTQAEIDKKQEELEGKQGELSDRVPTSTTSIRSTRLTARPSRRSTRSRPSSRRRRPSSKARRPTSRSCVTSRRSSLRACKRSRTRSRRC